MKVRALMAVWAWVLVGAYAVAQSSTPWTHPAADELIAIYPALEALYLNLHASPELAMHEQQTAGKLAARMKALGCDVTTGVRGTGVVAVMHNGSGPTVLLRTGTSY